MNRDKRATIARETLQILAQGEYSPLRDQVVDISQSLASCLTETRLWRPKDFPDDLTGAPVSNTSPVVEVTDETTLAAARRVTSPSATSEVLCLNFASAKNPGGGFLSGSQAQEESLARSSGLYASLSSQIEMYDYNRQLRTCLYSDHMIYSPHVPVFRNDDGKLLEEPYLVSFITAPAVNAGAVRKNEPQRVPEVQSTMERRLRRLLWIAKHMEHSILILGAWGCGVFGNDAATVADLFRRALGLSGSCRGWFQRVVYAVYDRSPGQETFKAFHSTLAEPGS